MKTRPLFKLLRNKGLLPGSITFNGGAKKWLVSGRRNVVTSSNFFGVELPVKCMFCNVEHGVIF